jgi:hypothetical protein
MPKQTGLTVDEITTILNSTHLYSENFPPLPSSNPPKSRQQSLPTNSPPLTQKAMEEEAFVPDYSPNSTPSPIPANNSHNEITTVEINRPPIRAPSPSIETTALKSLPASAGSSSLNRNRPLPLLSLSTTDHVVKTPTRAISSSRHIGKPKQNYPISILSRVRILDNGKIQKLPLEDRFIASRQLARLKKLTNREIKATIKESRLHSRISFVNSTNVANSTNVPQMDFSTVRKIHLNPNILFQSSSSNSLSAQPTMAQSIAPTPISIPQSSSFLNSNIFTSPPPNYSFPQIQPNTGSTIQHVPILVPISLFSAPGVSCPNFSIFPNSK